MMNRIIYLFVGILLLAGCQKKSQEALFDDGTSQYWNEEQAPFYHGVASGDPLPEAVIIWTRVTPQYVMEVEGKWTVALDESLSEVVQSGSFSTNGERDYTVKIDVQGLSPDTYYYYQFEALGEKSPVGRTKTAPAEMTDQVKFAIVSCSNFEAGYFNAFGNIAEVEELDAVLHLGDYIYEYAQGVYGDTTLGRRHLPNKEILELQDYRTRYAQYRLDPDFQKVHQMHPFITIWDDHEITNNAYQTGAQNHQPEEEGDYNIRKSVASQVYFEWLPVREKPGKILYRKLSYGNLVDLLMLDERLAGRSPQADSITQPDFYSSDRSMLGKEQLAWFKQQLSESDATWKVIGNQVIFSPLDISALGWRGTRNLDAWDGYPAEQGDIISFLKDNEIENVVFVTGDTHRAWAFEVAESIEAYKMDSTASVAVEFGVTSISSANTDENVSLDTTLLIEKRSMDPNYNPHMKYNNQHDHGYLLLTLNEEEAKAEFKVAATIRKPTKEEKTDGVVTVKKGSHDLILE